MRIKHIIPWQADPGLVRYEQAFVPSDVDVAGVGEGILGECTSDLARGLPATIDAIKQAEVDGYDAVLVACFGDVGVEESRELVDIPVLGPFNVALHVAGMIGHRVCVLLPEYSRLRLPCRRNLDIYGFRERAVLRGSEVTLAQALQAYQDYQASGTIGPFINEMADICVKSIEEDDADVIVLGCGGIKWIKDVLEGELAKRGYYVTVINPVPITVEIARAFASLGIAHNKRGYPPPPHSSERYCAIG